MLKAKKIGVSPHEVGNLVAIFPEGIDDRCLIMEVSSEDADIISLSVKGIKTEHPMIHDILENFMEEAGFFLEKVVIDNAVNRNPNAKLYYSFCNEQKIVDIRPTDGIVLALKAGKPIFVDSKMFYMLSLAVPQKNVEH